MSLKKGYCMAAPNLMTLTQLEEWGKGNAEGSVEALKA
jgi:hypothetical protein